MAKCVTISSDTPGCAQLSLRQGEPKIVYFKFTKSGAPVDLHTEYSNIECDIKRTLNNSAKAVMRKRFSNNGLVVSGANNDVLELHFTQSDTEDLSDTELIGDFKFIRNGAAMRLITIKISLGQVVTK